MIASVIIAAFASSALVAAVPVATRAQPPTWATGYLEEYDTYHTRYLALGCSSKHNTVFFNDCCHPLLSTESLSDRAPYCTPNATASSAASAYTETATATAAVDADASTQYSVATASVQNVISSDSAEEATTTTVADAVNNYAQQTSTTSSSEAAPSPTSTESNSGSSGQVMTGGFATFFYQDGGAGECGEYNSDSDYLIAIDAHGWWQDYQSNSQSPLCGKSIRITRVSNGKQVTARVVDVCPTCVSDNSLDLSVAAFEAIADQAEGSVAITWQWA